MVGSVMHCFLSVCDWTKIHWIINHDWTKIHISGSGSSAMVLLTPEQSGLVSYNFYEFVNLQV